ncbi:MAG: hypothetical protein ABSF35_17685 [Polyangia bacterium]
MTNSENANEGAKATVLQCAACGKLLATGTPAPRHHMAWCGCGGPGDFPDLFPWFECPTTGLAGFRLFRRIDKPGRSGMLGILKRFAVRLPPGKIALGLAGGALLGLALAGAFAVGATLAPTSASHTAAASSIVCH